MQASCNCSTVVVSTYVSTGPATNKSKLALLNIICVHTNHVRKSCFIVHTHVEC